MRRILKPALPIMIAAFAAGCDNDGDFDDFFERQDRGSEENYPAISRSVSVDASGATLALGNTDSEDLSADVDIDIDLVDELEGFRLNNTATNIDFSDDDADTDIDDMGDFYTVSIDDANQQAFGRIGDPASLGLAYHTFGAWVDIDGADMGDMVAVVTGEPTPGGSVPTTGTATFTGQSTGVYANESMSSPMLTNSDVTATVNFGGDSIALSSDNTTANGAAMGSLDFDGTLNIVGAFAQGNISTDGGLNGDARGLFAGPDASEFGGTAYAGDGDEAYVAGFGTRRQ